MHIETGILFFLLSIFVVGFVLFLFKKYLIHIDILKIFFVLIIFFLKVGLACAR